MGTKKLVLRPKVVGRTVESRERDQSTDDPPTVHHQSEEREGILVEGLGAVGVEVEFKLSAKYNTLGGRVWVQVPVSTLTPAKVKETVAKAKAVLDREIAGMVREAETALVQLGEISDRIKRGE